MKQFRRLWGFHRLGRQRRRGFHVVEDGSRTVGARKRRVGERRWRSFGSGGRFIALRGESLGWFGGQRWRERGVCEAHECCEAGWLCGNGGRVGGWVIDRVIEWVVV